jgi:hypothetical protein
MTPERLTECLSTIRWNPNTLAEAMDVPAQAVDDWLSGREDIPRKVAAWLEALCFVHEAADETRPATAGEGFDTAHRGEFIPVYAYNLLRNLNHAAVPLRSLFGTDDEGAVFFLVSRGLATREGANLEITDLGRGVGKMHV